MDFKDALYLELKQQGRREALPPGGGDYAEGRREQAKRRNYVNSARTRLGRTYRKVRSSRLVAGDAMNPFGRGAMDNKPWSNSDGWVDNRKKR
jgi:hypothetical protein